jgi:hypothetical protein
MPPGRAVVIALTVLVGLPSPAHAQRVGTLAEWNARVLDPAALGIAIFPGAAFNRKFTIDQIRLDETPAKMAVYLIGPEQMPAAAAFYATALGSRIEESGLGTAAELRVVRARPDDARRAGFVVRVENAHWATGKGQIWLRRDAPPSTP